MDDKKITVYATFLTQSLYKRYSNNENIGIAFLLFVGWFYCCKETVWGLLFR